MIENVLSVIERIVVEYGALGIFVGAVIEEVISIIPSAAVMMFAGFFVMAQDPLAVSSFLKFFLQVSLPIALGITLGSLFIYLAVYYLGKPAIDRFGKWFGLSWKDIEKVRSYIKGSRLDDLALFLARSIPVIPFLAINAVCGLLRWPFANYLLITFAGGFVRASIVGFLGWQLGRFYKVHVPAFEIVDDLVLLLLFLAAVLFLVYRGMRVKKTSEL